MKQPSSNVCQGALLADLRQVVSSSHVLVRPSAMRRHLRGFRYGSGHAIAVIRPGNLVEYWKVTERCVSEGVAVISQAANTGLTGGSTPFGEEYDRPVVVVNTLRMKGLKLLDGGRQVVVFPGTTLNELETALSPLGREPHSVIGSSCLGASVIGGVCNNSGGSLVRRGPSYTELALYARVDEEGRLRLVNELGIALSGDPVEVLQGLEEGDVYPGLIDWTGTASNLDYQGHVRDIAADTPARYNADPRKLRGASGSAGKVAIFAVRLDTFEAEKNAQVFYIGTNDTVALTTVRRSILSEKGELPIAGEYIHRDAFDVAATYGKDTYLLVKRIGTNRLPAFFDMKSRFDALVERIPFFPSNLSDRVLQFLSRLFPSHLPKACGNIGIVLNTISC